MNDRFKRCCIPLLVATLCACSDITPVSPRGSTSVDVKQASIDTTVLDGVYVDLLLTAQATVSVKYWPVGGGDTLSVLSPVPAAGGRILMPQLLPGRDYRYAVHTLNDVGEPGTEVDGAFHASNLPSELANVQFGVTGESTAPLSMIELSGDFAGFAALNRYGVPVWWWRTRGGPQGFTRRANGNFVVNDAGYGVYEVAPDGHVVHVLDASTSPALGPFTHHEVLATPDNTILLLAQDPRVVGDSVVTGDAIWEWSPETGQLVKRASVFDFLDPALDVGARSVSSDWVHANSLSYGQHGNLILSLNWLSEVISLAPRTYAVEWRLGGRNSSFALDPDAQFQGQHCVSELPNGHILMFDNERDRTGAARASRALELALDAIGKTAHRAWSYEPTPAIYAPYVGSVRRLDNGNTVVHFGLAEGYKGGTGPLTTAEVSPGGAVISRLVITNSSREFLSYRNEPIMSIAGERPTH